MRSELCVSARRVPVLCAVNPLVCGSLKSIQKFRNQTFCVSCAVQLHRNECAELNGCDSVEAVSVHFWYSPLFLWKEVELQSETNNCSWKSAYTQARTAYTEHSRNLHANPGGINVDVRLLFVLLFFIYNGVHTITWNASREKKTRMEKEMRRKNGEEEKQWNRMVARSAQTNSHRIQRRWWRSESQSGINGTKRTKIRIDLFSCGMVVVCLASSTMALYLYVHKKIRNRKIEMLLKV